MDPDIYQIHTKAAGPTGKLPVTEDLLLNRPSGDLFGMTMDAGMGWNPAELGRKQFLILSTLGGVRAPDGTPVALGYHTGHWEIGLLVQAAARELRGLGSIPFAGFVSDPCDGRTQGTHGMFDSLPYRNDAAQVFRRLIRSLPVRSGVMGVATCDKGLPRDDDGAGGNEGIALGPRSGWRDAAFGGRRGRGQGADARRALFARDDHDGEGGARRLPRVRVARRRLPVPRHGGDVAGRGRGAGPLAPALGARPLGPARVGRHRCAVGAGADAARIPRPQVEGHRDRRQRDERDDGPRGVRQFDEPAAPYPRHRPRGGSGAADG